METLQTPELTTIEEGKLFKTIQIVGVKGAEMLPHYTRQEAIIVVHEGEAILKMPNANHKLKQGDSFIIPAKLTHSLEIKKAFRAVVVIAIDSEKNWKTQD